jgi:hypothetical protein
MTVYNFQQMIKEGKLTEQQFNLLSWLAYAEYGHQVYKETKFKQGNIKGLQNYNRIASKEYYNHNIGYCSNY